MKIKKLCVVFAYNEGNKLEDTLKRFPPLSEREYDLVIGDDGSTDGCVRDEYINKYGVKIIIRNESNSGLSNIMKKVFHWAMENGYDAIANLNGNNKDEPKEITNLFAKIEEGYDFVQGARYIHGGKYGNMPLYRYIATKYVHPNLFSLISGKKVHDTTNGFRAFRVSILRDPRINVFQDRIQKYELESYMYYSVIKLNYKSTEIPATRIYPQRKQGFTKIKPFIGWWYMLRPLIGIKLGWYEQAKVVRSNQDI